MTRASTATLSAGPIQAYRDVLLSPLAERVLRQGAIIPDSLTPAGLLSRLLHRIAVIEATFGNDGSGREDVVADFHDLVRDGVVLLGSPLLTNIAYGDDRPLASCSAVPPAESLGGTLRAAEAYYRLNMGSGFDLNEAANPVEALRVLNAHAASVEARGACERYVGNMAHVDVDHPRIAEFVTCKVEDRTLLHFNISVNMNERFMTAVASADSWQLRDGSRVAAAGLWESLVEAAHACGDPGIISLERFNRDNPLAAANPYTTTAPCAEVGLASGETCVFGYISLAPLIGRGADGSPQLDFARLGCAARVLTQILDDAVEHSSEHQPDARSRHQHRFSRKIGIGICGYADALMLLGIRYGSEDALQLLRDVLATINFESKVQSASLAQTRKPFDAFALSTYRTQPGWTARFRSVNTVVPDFAWADLEARVSASGLRNVMTCALPPSGRVSLLLGVASSIEPYLSLRRDASQPIALNILNDWGVFGEGDRVVDWPRRLEDDAATIVRDAYDLSIDEHLDTVATAATFVDDGVSKTVNLPHSSTPSQVSYALWRSWTAGLKAMSVYRRGSHPSERPVSGGAAYAG